MMISFALGDHPDWVEGAMGKLWLARLYDHEDQPVSDAAELRWEEVAPREWQNALPISLNVTTNCASPRLVLWPIDNSLLRLECVDPFGVESTDWLLCHAGWMRFQPAIADRFAREAS